MCSWMYRQEGPFQWTLLAEWESVVLGSPEWPLDRWRRLYQVECVKQGPHRVVYRIKTPQGDFYAKHYRSPRWTDPWRNLFRGCPARREFQTLQVLTQRQVPTLRPIAWGKPHGWRGLWDSLLLTEALPNAQSLDQFFRISWPQFPPKDQPRVLRSLIEELACFLAQCHEAGILHEDLHTGNILVEGNSGPSDSSRASGFRFFLIDAQAVRVGEPLDREASLRNLSYLAGAWRERTTPAQRWRFWKRYCQARPGIPFHLRKDAERIDQLGWKQHLRICRRLDRRSLATNRDFMALNACGNKIYALADQDPDLLHLWALAPEVLVEEFLHRAVKLGHRSLVIEADWPPAGESMVRFSEASCAEEHPMGKAPLPAPHFSMVSFPCQAEDLGKQLGGKAVLFSEFGPSYSKADRERRDSNPEYSSSETPPVFRKASCCAIIDLRSPAGEKNLSGDIPPSFGNEKAPQEAALFLPGRSSGTWADQKRQEMGSPSIFRAAIKRFRERVGWAGWRRYFRTSRAIRAWWAGHALLRRGIATPRPIALCEPAFRGTPYYTYLVSEWIPESQNLHLWGWQIARLPPPERHKLAAQCAETLGRLIGRLHAFRISHGDLKMSNILVAHRSGRLNAWLLDVEGVRIGGPRGRRYLRDLGRLAIGLQAHPWVSPTVLCRFLRTYVHQFPPFARPDWKILWRAIRTEFERLLNKKKFQGGRLL